MSDRTTKTITRRVASLPRDLEHLEKRQLLAAATAVSLPFRLDFNQNIAGTLFDKDGQGTGFTGVQANKYGTEYQQNLIDLDVNKGTLSITTTGTASAGSNAGSDNTLTNALETAFNGSSGNFQVTTRLLGTPTLQYMDDAYEQAGIYIGPDQDNYIKVVAIKLATGQFLQFKDEINGVSSVDDAQSTVDIGYFGSITTLDLRIVGDATTGKVTAYYNVNDTGWKKVDHEFTLSGSAKSAFFNANSKAGLITSHKNNVGPITAVFDMFEIRAGVPMVTGTRPGNGETGISRDSFIAADVYLPVVGAGIDSTTLNASTVRLYNKATGMLITGAINTSGGGDAIVFTPSQILDANTTYVFEITDGVKDIQGNRFLPYKVTFTTGTAGVQTDTSIQFNKAVQNVTVGIRHTSLTFGPDGKLYTTTIDGKIIRYDVAADGTLSNPYTINTIVNKEGKRRSAMAIVFDPSSTAGNLIAYVSHSDFAGLELKEYATENLGAAQNWTGKITKLTGANLQNAQDIVTGLPRSVRDHQNYQMAFGADDKLYISQSSMSAMGAPDSAWGNQPEVLLSAAILQINVQQIGSGTVNVRTDGSNPYNPYAPNAPVKIYATGLRSAYDLLFHSNGKLYSATNGSAAGGNTPAGGGAPGLTNVPTQHDYMFIIEEGGYYGHPNPLRGEYVLNGGNPTSSVDPGEVDKYPVGTQPAANYKGYVYDFGLNYSPNGMIEYKGNAFNGALDGKILIVRYSGGDDIMVLTPNAQGQIVSVQTGYAGLTGFINPLDIIQNPNNGNLYVIEFGDQAQTPDVGGARITMLSAVASQTGGNDGNQGGTPSNNGTHAATLSRNKVYLSDQTGGGSSAAQTVRITNTGTGPLTIAAATFSGTNASEFSLTNPLNGTLTLQPGERYDFYVVFKATNSGQMRTAQLNITTNAGVQNVALRALGLGGTGGSYEPSLQRILDLYQIGINVGDNDPSTTEFPVDTAYSADEVDMPRLIKSGTGPITVELLGTFANQNAATILGWYEAGNPQTTYQLAKVAASRAQSIAPLEDGQFTFDPGSKSFGLWGNFTLGSTSNPKPTDVYSEPSLNTWETNASRQKKVRFYKLRDANGNIVENAYVFAFEEYNVTFDQNDIVGIIRNVKPAAVGPEIGLQNLDSGPFADHLAMNRITNLDTRLPNTVHDTATLRVRNTGNQPLVISSMVLSNNDFQIVSGGGARTLAPGAYVDVVIKFVYTASNKGNSLRTATLTINSNDADEPAKVVTLNGLWQSHSEDAPAYGSAEPSAIQIIQALGYGTKLTTGSQKLNTNGAATAVGEEVLSELWTRADPGLKVTVTQLAAFHQQYNENYLTRSTISYYNPTNINGSTGKPNVTKILAHQQSDGQSILPRIENSTTQYAVAQFIPNSTNFGFKVEDTYSEMKYNVSQWVSTGRHAMRFYPAKDKNGNVIPDTYIMVQDYVLAATADGKVYANFDYQDNIYVIHNIRPVNGPTAVAKPTTSASSAGIALAWAGHAAGNVAGYNVYRASSADGTYTKINSELLTGTQFLDTTAPVGATSYYIVKAVDYHGTEGAASPVANATRTSGGGTVVTPPAAPTGLSTSALSGGGVTLTWTDNSNNETGFRIERQTSGGAWSTIATVAAGVTSFTDTSTAAASTTYGYRVVAFNAGGDSSASNVSTVTTTANTPSTGSLTSTNIGNPAPAGGVSMVTPGKDYDVTVGGVDIWGTYDSFNFLYEQRTGNFDVAVRVTGLTYGDSGAMAGIMARESLATGAKNVHIKVKPGSYRMTYRSSTNGTTVGVGTAEAVTPNAYVRLKREGNVFTAYISSDGVNWTVFATQTVSMGSTIYVGLATSGHSTTSTATANYRGYGDTVLNPTTPTAPAAPTGLTATANSQTKVTLNWADNASNETGYRIERKTGNGSWVTLIDLSANTTSYQDSSVIAGTTYTYRVTALGTTNSAPSNEASVTTPSNPSTGGVTLQPKADAYVRNGSAYSQQNFSSTEFLEVKYDSGNGGYGRQAYIEFDLSSVSSAASVVLRLSVRLNDVGSVPLVLYGVSTSATWTETGITWSNKPATSSKLGQVTVSSTTEQWVEFDVTGYVQGALAAGRTSVSFALTGASSSSPFIRVGSRESASPAQLVINGGGAGSTPPTQPENPGENPGNPGNPGTTITRDVLADTYVYDGSNASSNFGTGTSLAIKKGGNGYNRHTYLKFDISNLGDFTTAKLRLTANLNTADSVQMAIFGVNDTSWSETGLTWNNKPAAANGALATAIVSSTSATEIEIDLTAYIKAAIAAGKTTISLSLQGTASSTAFINVASRESGAGPQLVFS